MLDSFIIEKIRRDRESRDSARAPLHIELPREQVDDDVERRRQEKETNEEPERGVVIIDFTI